jgi:hypothetical protein
MKFVRRNMNIEPRRMGKELRKIRYKIFWHCERTLTTQCVVFYKNKVCSHLHECYPSSLSRCFLHLPVGFAGTLRSARNLLMTWLLSWQMLQRPQFYQLISEQQLGHEVNKVFFQIVFGYSTLKFTFWLFFSRVDLLTWGWFSWFVFCSPSPIPQVHCQFLNYYLLLSHLIIFVMSP